MISKMFSIAICLLGLTGFIIGMAKGQYFEACAVLLIFGGLTSMIIVTSGQTDELRAKGIKIRGKSK